MAKSRVVVIDDRPVVADALCRMLRHECPGTDIRLFRHPTEASRAAGRCRDIDLVIARLSLHGADALELMRSFRARGVLAPWIVLAATGEERLAEAAFVRGAAGFVPETRSGPALAIAVLAVLDGWRAFPSRGLSPAGDVSDDFPSSAPSVPTRRGDAVVWLPAVRSVERQAVRRLTGSRRRSGPRLGAGRFPRSATPLACRPCDRVDRRRTLRAGRR